MQFKVLHGTGMRTIYKDMFVQVCFLFWKSLCKKVNMNEKDPVHWNIYFLMLRKKEKCQQKYFSHIISDIKYLLSINCSWCAVIKPAHEIHWIIKYTNAQEVINAKHCLASAHI